MDIDLDDGSNDHQVQCRFSMEEESSLLVRMKLYSNRTYLHEYTTDLFGCFYLFCSSTLWLQAVSCLPTGYSCRQRGGFALWNSTSIQCLSAGLFIKYSNILVKCAAKDNTRKQNFAVKMFPLIKKVITLISCRL